MTDLFSPIASESAKTHGMASAAAAQPSALALARIIARELCRTYGETTSDDVGQVLLTRYGIESLGPAAGSIFKSGDFQATGRFRKSERVANHSRLLTVWRLKDGAV